MTKVMTQVRKVRERFGRWLSFLAQLPGTFYEDVQVSLLNTVRLKFPVTKKVLGGYYVPRPGGKHWNLTELTRSLLDAAKRGGHRGV